MRNKIHCKNSKNQATEHLYASIYQSVFQSGPGGIHISCILVYQELHWGHYHQQKHPHIPKQEAAQLLPRQWDAAHKLGNKEQQAQEKLKHREGYLYPADEHSVSYSQQSFDLVDLFAWNRTACLEGRKSMKAIVIKAKLLQPSEGKEVVCLNLCF